MKNYTNGYWPKIQYWNSKLNEAITNGDLKGVDSTHNKMNYFIGKQWDLEFTRTENNSVKNVIAGVDFSDSLNLLKSL